MDFYQSRRCAGRWTIGLCKETEIGPVCTITGKKNPTLLHVRKNAPRH